MPPNESTCTYIAPCIKMQGTTDALHFADALHSTAQVVRHALLTPEHKKIIYTVQNSSAYVFRILEKIGREE